MSDFEETVLETGEDKKPTKVRRDYHPVPVTFAKGKEVLPPGHMRVFVPRVGVCSQKPSGVITPGAVKEKK